MSCSLLTIHYFQAIMKGMLLILMQIQPVILALLRDHDIHHLNSSAEDYGPCHYKARILICWQDPENIPTDVIRLSISGPMCNLTGDKLASKPYLTNVFIGCKNITLSSASFHGSSAIRLFRMSSAGYFPPCPESPFTLPLGIFNDMKNVEKIHLVEIGLDYLPPRIFFNQQHLIILDLSKNQLKEISTETFAGLMNLQVCIYVGQNLNSTLKYSRRQSIQFLLCEWHFLEHKGHNL